MTWSILSFLVEPKQRPSISVSSLPRHQLRGIQVDEYGAVITLAPPSSSRTINLKAMFETLDDTLFNVSYHSPLVLAILSGLTLGSSASLWPSQSRPRVSTVTKLLTFFSKTVMSENTPS
jgi:hypothetical protein